MRVEGKSPALVDEIRELGLDYGIVTPYTTFVIAAQAEGAASLDNVILYNHENQARLNAISGQTTIQARVQNQAYQQADRADLAVGDNILNRDQHSLAQVAGPQAANLNVDLSILRGQKNLAEPVTMEWIEDNVGIDRAVIFGSEEYFDLADDPAVRPFLQSGTNVVFAYQEQVIYVPVNDTPAPNLVASDQTALTSWLSTIYHGLSRVWSRTITK